jgi:hypothetical protein
VDELVRSPSVPERSLNTPDGAQNSGGADATAEHKQLLSYAPSCSEP